MTSVRGSRRLVGRVFEITSPEFTPRITIHSSRQLTVEIVGGHNAGFSDTIEYDAVEIREGLLFVSWVEHIGSTIVHVLDLTSGGAHTRVTPAKGGFLRLRGRIQFAR